MAKHISFFVAEACVIIILCALVKMICLNYLLLLLLLFGGVNLRLSQFKKPMPRA